jgi:hypothetical protein
MDQHLYVVDGTPHLFTSAFVVCVVGRKRTRNKLAASKLSQIYVFEHRAVGRFRNKHLNYWPNKCLVCHRNPHMLDWTSSPFYTFLMGKKPEKKKRQPDYQQVARKVLDAIAPDAEPSAIKPAKKPLVPKRKQDAADVERAEGEGMAQPQVKNPAAVALGRLGGLKGGKARAAKLSPAKRKAIAKKAAATRWKNASKG